MALAHRLTTLMTSLTDGQIKAMSEAEKQALSNECVRIYRIIEGGRIMDDARAATAPKVPAFLQILRDNPREG
jgi:hypothetical protein